jgi:hypothetical protein
MLTIFYRDSNSKHLYFKLSSSFQITSINEQGSTLKFAGLYAIFKGENCYYVGQSQNLASRLSQHLTGKYLSCDRVCVYLAKSNGFENFDERTKQARKEILEANEFHLMNLLKPIENIITPPSDFKCNEDGMFNCFSYQDEDVKDICDISIYPEKHTILISECITPDLDGIKAISEHNKIIIEATEKFGAGKAKEYYCNG